MASETTDDTFGSELLRCLSPGVRECLLSRGRFREVACGETLCLQGEKAGTLKIVTKGWIKLFRVNEEGSEAIVDTLGTGECFDEVPALLGKESTNSAEAVTDAQVLVLSLSDICACTNARAEISNAVLSATQTRMTSMTEQIEGLKIKSASQRLGEFLLALSDEGGGKNTFGLPFGKVVIAGMLGMKPESLSRAFSRLKDVGVFSSKGEVQIDDLTTLRDWTLHH